MRICVDDPAFLPDLAAALRARIDAVVTEAGPRELEVSLLDSRTGPDQRLELEGRLARWRRSHPQVNLSVDDAGRE